MLETRQAFIYTYTTSTALPLPPLQSRRGLMDLPDTKKSKMEGLSWSGSASSSASASAVPSGRSPPPPMVRYRCKQKQYYSVLWSLQFLLALLKHPFLAPFHPDSRSPEKRTTTAAPPPSSRIQAFLEAAEGAGSSFDVEGPLSGPQLLSLQDRFTKQEVRDICVQCLHAYVRQRVPTAPPLTVERVFAAPTELMKVLWPTQRFCRHYTAALEAAHHGRIHHSDLLATPGYLQEAGLHASIVLADSSLTDPLEVRASEEWRRLIDAYTAFLPDRSRIHELENLPQEVAIGELLRDAAAALQQTAPQPGFALDCVVDVGGGNGFLAAQAAERLDCDGVVIDPFFPAHAIDCCPRMWPDTPHRTRPSQRRRRTLHRTLALFRAVRWADVVPAAPSRTALVAKHLCGSGVDEVLQRLDVQGCLPRILVLAPCCFNKVSFDAYCNSDFLRRTMGIASDAALARVHKLTDWNMSCYQSSQEALLAQQEAARRHVSFRGDAPQMGSVGASAPPKVSSFLSSAATAAPVTGTATPAHFSHQRRSGRRSIVNSITCTHAFARLVEGLLNHGRVEWLERRGYNVRLVQYVPEVVTPKNKCLLAVRRA